MMGSRQLTGRLAGAAAIMTVLYDGDAGMRGLGMEGLSV